MLANNDFELYTEAGNQFAGSLIHPLIAEILEDRLTRKQAIERVKDAIKQIRAVDEGMADSESYYNIWSRVNRAFKKVGYERWED